MRLARSSTIQQLQPTHTGSMSLATLSHPFPISSSSCTTQHASPAPFLPGDSSDATSRCRYKTGRCMHARVVKPNGTLLLLCEYHRNQQNRTKMRSDMKYRHYRAKKRLLEKQDGLPTALTSPVLPPPRSVAIPMTPLVAPPTASSTDLSPVVSTAPPLASRSCRSGLHTPGSVLAKRECASDAAAQKSALYKISSGLRSAAIGCRISPGKGRMGALRTRSHGDAFALNRRDIVAMASPHKLVASPPMLPQPPSTADLELPSSPLPSPLSHLLFPLSPLRLSPPRTWQPEELQLLEYFLL